MDVRALLPPGQHAEDTSESEPQTTAIIFCPKKMVGRVIGKNGETIKALQNFTGAQIQIDQRQDPTRVSIAGSPTALVTANNMVQDIVAGTFKGFAMLRAYANQNPRTTNGFELMSQQAPVYIKGYGFVPPSQFASDPADGFNIPQGYADPFQQAALQNTFAGNTSYQPGLPGTMLSQNVPYVDPAQIQNLFQAQLLSRSQQQGLPTQLPGAQTPGVQLPGVQMPGLQIPAVPQVPNIPLGVQQAASNYMLNPAAGYGLTGGMMGRTGVSNVRDPGDPAMLAAQLEAMNLQQTSEALQNPANSHPNHQNSQQGRSASAQGRVANGTSGNNYNNM